MGRSSKTGGEGACAPPRGEWQGKTTSDERAFELFRYWARGFIQFEGVIEVDDLAGWAWCEWASRGRKYLGNRLIVRNLGIDAIRNQWGRSTTYRARGEQNTYPMSNFPQPCQDRPNMEAMIDLQRLWDQYGLEGRDLFDDPRRWKLRSGVKWTAYL